jgi:DUF3108-like
MMLTATIISIIIGVTPTPAGATPAATPGERTTTSIPTEEEISIIDHFPLVDGLKWKYESNMGEVVSWVTVTGDQYTVTSESSPLDIKQVFRLTPEGLILIEAEMDTWLTSDRRTYLPSLLRFPLSVTVGEEWLWEGKEVLDDDIINSVVKGKIIGWDNITVPAGTYRCLNVLITTTSDDGTTTSSTQWLAPGIGIVKAEIAVDAGGFSGFVIALLGFDTYNLELEEIIKPIVVSIKR